MSTCRNAWGARVCGFSKGAAVYPSVYLFFHADSRNACYYCENF